MLILVHIFLLTFFNLSVLNAKLSFEVSEQEAPKTKIIFFGLSSNEQILDDDANYIFELINYNLKTTNLFTIIKDDSAPRTILERDNGLVQSQINKIMPKVPNEDNLSPYIFGEPEEVGVEIIDAAASEKIPLVTVEMLPDFQKYSNAEIGAIAVTQISYDFEGNLEMKLRLWDVLEHRQILGKYYSASRDNYKKLANTISDDIFMALTGEKSGHFNSIITYVSETGPIRKRIKKIAVIDFDGGNHLYLTSGKHLVLTPVFAKKPHEIFYLSYKSRSPQIYNLDTYSLRSERVGGFYGTTFAASPHPIDENILLISAIFDGNSDIYEMHMKENKAIRLTKNQAIDTTANYSVDGKEIIFISDRNGSQQIYKMGQDGSNLRRISRGQGSYSKPIFSPSGNLIVFTVIRHGMFFVGTMNPDGSDEKLLTSAYLVEGARFSPNGRYLIYSKTRKSYGPLSIPRLFTIDIATGYEREIPMPKGEGATDPDWKALN